MATGQGTALAGRGVVITRPERQARGLAELVRAAGGTPILYPAIEIREARDMASLDAVIDRLDEFDLAVFVSRNAAAAAMARILGRRALPAGLAVAAVGPGTARELAAFGVAGTIAPPGHGDSESLLALPPLAHPRGRRVVIFRGDGGRELIADTLRARGAHVEYANCYRRGRPAAVPAPLLEAFARGSLHAIVVTSSEGARNLRAMLGEAGAAILAVTPVLASHPRLARTARELGCATVLVADAPGDEALVAALARYFGHDRAV
ncbi:MAG: uroporphyrinogen-III synthase [Burkholderiales bacterium]|nr:uroporphyrinogen-III synthase [Burkholderiales bacterium]